MSTTNFYNERNKPIEDIYDEFLAAFENGTIRYYKHNTRTDEYSVEVITDFGYNKKGEIIGGTYTIKVRKANNNELSLEYKDQIFGRNSSERFAVNTQHLNKEDRKRVIEMFLMMKNDKNVEYVDPYYAQF